MKFPIVLFALSGTCLALPRPLEAGAEDLTVPNPTEVIPQDLTIPTPTKVSLDDTIPFLTFAESASGTAAPVRLIDDPNWGKWPPSPVYPPPPAFTKGYPPTIPWTAAFSVKWPDVAVNGAPPSLPTPVKRELDGAEDLPANVLVDSTTSAPMYQPTASFARITIDTHEGTTWAGVPPESRSDVGEVASTGLADNHG